MRLHLRADLASIAVVLALISETAAWRSPFVDKYRGALFVGVYVTAVYVWITRAWLAKSWPRKRPPRRQRPVLRRECTITALDIPARVGRTTGENV